MDNHPKYGDDVTLAREAFAKALRVQLAAVGINRRDLSHRTRRNGAEGVSDGTIGRWTRGEVTPRWEEQLLIADALGIEPGDLERAAVIIYKEMRDERDG